MSQSDSTTTDSTPKAAPEPTTAGGAQAIDSLIEALNDNSSIVRRDAARALGETHDPRAFEPLLAVLKHYDKNTQIAAAEALGTLGDKRAIESLSDALRREYFETYDAIKAALEKLGASDIVAAEQSERTKRELKAETQSSSTRLLLWGAGLLAAGLVCSLGSYIVAGVQAAQQAASTGIGSATYVVFTAPILIGGILLAAGTLRRFGVRHWGKGLVALVFVGLIGFADVQLLASKVLGLADSPIYTPVMLAALVGGFILAARLSSRSWREVLLAALVAFLAFGTVSSMSR